MPRYACLLFVWCALTFAVTTCSAAEADDHSQMTHTPGAADATAQVHGVSHYSLFMHRSSGVMVLILGMLMYADRYTDRKVRGIAVAVGLLWLVFGTHLFIRSDPEGWPMTDSFRHSLTMPTSSEWIQHKLLSLIPIALGVWTLWFRRAQANLLATYVLGGVLVLGGLALTVHQHLDHPTMDVVNLQHRFMATTSLFIAGSFVADGLIQQRRRVLPYLVPLGLVILGFQLALYIE